MKGFGLSNYLEVFGLNGKDEMSYHTLQTTLNQPQADISSIVNYCMRDVEALYDIEKHKNVLATLFALQGVFQLPISMVLHQTHVQNCTIYLLREYVNAGYHVRYQVEEREKVKYRGALTINERINEVLPPVIMEDFGSLYPTCIAVNNISPESIAYEPSLHCHAVDCSDDPTSEHKTLYFSSQQGIMSKFVSQMKQQRKDVKRLHGEAKKNGDPACASLDCK
jgi:DNA polymerase elongation subunit (family B)